VDVWKENILENLEAGLLEYKTVGEFLMNIRKEFGKEEEELVKVTELRILEQRGRTMEEFIQEFRRVARGSKYEKRPLVKEFKRGMSGTIRRKLMETEMPPTSIEQWYECTTKLDKHWRESKKKEERMRGRRKQGMTLALKQQVPRRQEMPQQRVMEPTPIEGVERTNIVVIRNQG